MDLALNADVHETLIAPGRGMRNYWGDLWQFRELFYLLAWRDIAVRYKQTVIGIAWSVIRPLLTMVIFTVVFGRLAHLPSPGVPYPILVFAGLLPWMFFASSLVESSDSLVRHASVISKVYFPRLVLPASSVIVSLVDFLISLGLLVVLMAIFRFVPSIWIVTLPFFLLLAFFTSFGSGLWLAALNVKYRDFRIIVPFIVQLGMYISPVGFSSRIVPAQWRVLYGLNPMVGIIGGFRWSILGTPMDWLALIEAVAVTALLCLGGLRYFYQTERTFADVI